MQHPTYKRGFTLIELSIVLVIIGLIVGGVLVGRDLVNAAQLRTIMRDIDQFSTATNTFMTKYNCFPGDCTRATDFFGTASGGCSGGARSGTQTCNGNGDARIANSGDGNGFSDPYEQFLFWQHLAISGMIPGTYTGLQSSSDHVFGTNAPANKTLGNNTGYSIYHLGTYAGDSGFYGSDYGNLFFYGKYLANYMPINPALLGIDAFGIDQKFDDGIPSTGRIMSLRASRNSGCTTSDTASSATYVRTSTTISCSLLIKAKF